MCVVGCDVSRHTDADYDPGTENVHMDRVNKFMVRCVLNHSLTLLKGYDKMYCRSQDTC